jgi:hypothetical protein
MTDTEVEITAKNKILREAFGIGSITKTSLDTVRLTVMDDEIHMLGMDSAKGLVVEYILKNGDGITIRSTIGDSPGMDSEGEDIPANIIQIIPKDIIDGLKKGQTDDIAVVKITPQNVIVKSGRLTRNYRALSARLIPSKWNVPNLEMSAVAVLKRDLFRDLFRPLEDIDMVRVIVNKNKGIDVHGEEDHRVKGATYAAVSECKKFGTKDDFDVIFGTDYLTGIGNYIPADIEEVTFKLAQDMPCYVLFGNVRCVVAPRVVEEL